MTSVRFVGKLLWHGTLSKSAQKIRDRNMYVRILTVDPMDDGPLMLAERLQGQGLAYSDAWNFGPVDGDDRPVSWTVEKLVRRWGDGAPWRIDESHQPQEAGLLKLE